MTTGLPDFFKYNLWANLRLLDVCFVNNCPTRIWMPR